MSTHRWYAVATQPRHEKVVADRLEAASVEAYLPILNTPSQWKDRRVTIARPIFPGYVFTRIDLDHRTGLYRVPGVVRILCFNGKPCPIEDGEIDAVRTCLTKGLSPEAHEYPAIGDRVRVTSGALEGLEGIVSRQKGELRIVVSIHLIHRSISAEVDRYALQVLDPAWAEKGQLQGGSASGPTRTPQARSRTNGPSISQWNPLYDNAAAMQNLH